MAKYNILFCYDSGSILELADYLQDKLKVQFPIMCWRTQRISKHTFALESADGDVRIRFCHPSWDFHTLDGSRFDAIFGCFEAHTDVCLQNYMWHDRTDENFVNMSTLHAATGVMVNWIRKNVKSYLMFSNSSKAERVLRDMRSAIDEYGYVTTQDLKDILVDADVYIYPGIPSSNDAGWTDLSSVEVKWGVNYIDTFSIEFPMATKIDKERIITERGNAIIRNEMVYKPIAPRACGHSRYVAYNHFLNKCLNVPKPLPKIKNVIFNNPATIVLWADGTKTVVKVQNNESFDPEKGLAMAISKKALGNKGNYYNTFTKWLPIPRLTLDMGVKAMKNLASIVRDHIDSLKRDIGMN